MIRDLFQGSFDGGATVIEPEKFLLCMAVSLVVGVILAVAGSIAGRQSRSFLLTLGVLPCVVCVVIMMVNGNIGAGVAVAGAFSLVRFRSVPGSAQQIVLLFLAMGAGMITGMGYLTYGILFAVVMGAVSALWGRLFSGRKADPHRTLTVTVPEDLDYCGALEPVLQRYTRQFELIRVKTTNMGSLFKLTYRITMTDPAKEKEMIDLLRCRNGNLEISCARQELAAVEL